MMNVPARFTLLCMGMLAIGFFAATVQADTVVQINLNGYVTGIFGDQVSSYQVQLFNSQTPITTANFLQYVNNSAYNGTIIHRDVPDFIIQGGGFKLQVVGNTVTGIDPIATYGTIQNEFDPSRSNLRGTIAMAKLGSDPNSATSQWFVNLGDNSANLDNQNGGFTVFGHVAGEGMSLVDAVAGLPTYDINYLYDPYGALGYPFTDVPLFNSGSNFVTIQSVSIIPTVEWKGGTTGTPSDWGVAGNWVGGSGVPNAVGVSLSIGSDVAQNTVLDLGSANRTVGNIYYTIPNGTTIQSTGGKSLTLDNGANTSLVNVLGDHHISAAMILKSKTLFSVNGTLDVSGGISSTGAFDLAKNDTGVLTLSGTNTYTGRTLVTEGTLTAVKAASLSGYGTSGKVVVSDGAKLYIRAGAATGEWTSAEIDTLRSNAVFNSGSILGIDTTGGNFSYGSAMGGSLGLTKLGSNMLTLTGANSFTGAVDFNDGVIKAASLNNLGAGSALNFNGGVLQFNGVFDPSSRIMTFQSGAATFDTQTNDITLANSVGNGGNGGLTKQGSGTLTLSASAHYLGGTKIEGGTLRLGPGATLPSTTTVFLSASGATFDINGNSQAIALLAGVTGTEVKLGGGTLTTGDNNSTNFSGAITSTSGGSLVKTGNGTFTMTGTNAYAGTTTVTGGILGAGSTASLPGYNLPGKAIVNADAALMVRAGAAGEWAASDIDTLRSNANFISGSYLGIDTTGGDFTYGSDIGGDIGIAKMGDNTLTLTGANTYTVNTLIFKGTLITLNAASLPGYDVTDKVNVYEGGTLIVRAGAPTGEWAASEIDALLSNATFASGIVFGIDTTGGDFSYAGGISGSLALTKLGANTLTLSGVNTFTGPLTFSGGLIKAAGLSNLGIGGEMIFDGGGLQFDNAFDCSVRTMTFQSGGAILDTQDKNVVLANDVGNYGDGGLTKNGIGKLTLTSSNSFSGPVNFNGGLIKAAILNNLGTGDTLNFNGGGLQFDGLYDPSVRTMTFQSGAATLDTQANNIPLAHTIGNGGNGGLTKLGSGTLTLSQSPNYKGGTVIGGGTLKLGLGAVLPTTTPVNLTASGATLDINGNLQTIASLAGVAGSEVKLGGGGLTTGNSTATTFAGVISSTSGGSLTKSGAGTFTLTGTNTFAGAVNFNNGLIKAGASNNLGAGTALNFSGGGLQFDGAFDPSARTMTFLTGGATLDTQGNSITFASSIGNNGVGGLTKNGSGILTLSASPTYKGVTVISGGTLLLGSGAILPNTAIISLFGSGTVLNINGNSETIASLAGLAGSEVKLGGGALSTGDGTSTIFAGVISSTSGGSLTKTGAGTFTLTSTNTFAGAVNFNNGLIKAGASNNLGAGTALNFSGGGLQFDGVFDPSARTMTFLTGGATLDTQANNIIMASTAGAIGNSGVGGLTKQGSGVLEITGAVSYMGPTAINAGVLKINNNQNTVLGAISGSGNLNVSGATTVLNADSINVSTLTIGAGSKVVIKALPGGPGDVGIIPIQGLSALIPVPEPSSFVLLGIAALAGLFAARRRK